MLLGLAAAALTAVLGSSGPPGCHDGSRGELEVLLPVLDGGGLRIDGFLDEEVWEHAALLCGFTQFDPVEGDPASQRTEVLVFLSADALHFGVRAFDDHSGGIRASLRDRDNVSDSDDYVRFVLDTFNDRRRAYVFTVNPLGVQEDGVWVEGGTRTHGGWGPPIDKNLDLVWESEGRMEEWGYALEVRIPLKSLRFRNVPLQAWGVNVERRIQRTGAQESWAPITRDEANALALAGTLEGLEGLDPGLFLEANPVLTGRRTGTRHDETGTFVRDDPRGELGLNLTYGITSNLTLDATLNPDFSQVEADAGQITANERFAIRIPEKRPFFLQGTEVFALSQPLVFTRTIVNPAAGAKVTGKQGPWSMGYLVALDDPAAAEQRLAVNLVRVRRDLGESSTAGVVYTDRTAAGGGHNRVAGADLRLVLVRRYTLQLLAAGSSTEVAEEGSLRRSLRRGSLYFAELRRSGRELSYGLELEEISPGFRAESGFIPRVGDTRVKAETSVNRYGASGALVERVGVTADAQGFWGHEAFRKGQGRMESELQLGVSVSFRGRTSLFLTGFMADFIPGMEAYDGLFVGDGGSAAHPFRPDPDLFQGLFGVRALLFSRGLESVRGMLRLQWRETPLFDRDLRVPLEPGQGWTADLNLGLFLARALTAEVGLLHEAVMRRDGGGRASVATIPRLRAQYQFTKAFFFRTITEYARQERAAPLDPATGGPLTYCEENGCTLREGFAEARLLGQFLLGYQPSPGTVFFAGYSRTARDSGPFRFQGMEPLEDGLFVKGSYRFRF
jgi:hypothetical protein